MKQTLKQVFELKKKNVLNIYCTAGFPKLDSTSDVLLSLQDSGADIIELGIPYSDPIADGPVIQDSNMTALNNGITLQLILQQLDSVKDKLHVPVILMGYLNPVLQYGFEKFCQDAVAAGASALILPDMPVDAFENKYGKIVQQYGLDFIFLITPQTAAERIKRLDKLSSGFLYAVSSSSTTGSTNNEQEQLPYFEKIKNLKLKNPVLIGFGIKDKHSFEQACSYANGAIIGSAYIKAIADTDDVPATTKKFIDCILH